jgi:hypothetical protein|tara:strand:+ start:279 stop:497 length:219 start_codon:yes stop_codon:yes gene_type:complete
MSIEIILRNKAHFPRERVPMLMRDIAQLMANYGLEMKLTETHRAASDCGSVYMGTHFGDMISVKKEEKEEEE